MIAELTPMRIVWNFSQGKVAIRCPTCLLFSLYLGFSKTIGLYRYIDIIVKVAFETAESNKRQFEMIMDKYSPNAEEVKYPSEMDTASVHTGDILFCVT